MSKTCTKRESGNNAYVDVDISRTEESGSYKDHCENDVSITRKSPFQGFKSYVHTFANSTYAAELYYNGTPLTGLGNIKNSLITEVCVYYWDHDKWNVFPLLVRITSGHWYSYYYYYARKNKFTDPDQWTRVEYSMSEKNILSKLEEIDMELRHTVILNLNVKRGEKYNRTGHATRQNFGRGVVIKVIKSEVVCDDYIKNTHEVGGSYVIRSRILSTIINGKNVPFSQPIINLQYNNIYVYYSKNDIKVKKPLLLELTHTNRKTELYILKNGEEWVEYPTTTTNLKDVLNRENNTHVIDVIRANKEYKCSSPGCNQMIQVSTPDFGGKFSPMKHSIKGSTTFSISLFIQKEVPQAGLPSPRNVNHITVLWYPKNVGTPSPLLIHYKDSEGDKWYRRRTPDSNNWSEVKNGPKWDDEQENEDVTKILEDIYSPKITINITPGIGLRMMSSTTYESGRQTVKIENKTMDPKFLKLVHTRVGGYFKLHDISIKGTLFSGIVTDVVLERVNVYYRVGDSSHDKPLLIELKHRDNDECTYIFNDGKEWNNETTKCLTEENLKSKLEKSHDIHYPPPSVLQVFVKTSAGIAGTLAAIIAIVLVGGTKLLHVIGRRF